MRWLRIIFDFYIDASVHVAFSVFALVHITAISLGFPVDEHLSWFLFFGTISCYNFMKYGVEAKKYILVANRYHKNIQFFSFIAFLGALYHFYFVSERIWGALTIIFVLTFLYALPVLPRSKQLRSWGGLKIVVVALVWSVATVILPALNYGQLSWWDVNIEAIRRFLLVFILMVPFEIRDLVYDSPEMKTIPQRVGIAQTKVYGALANVPLFFLVLFKDALRINELIASGFLFLGLGILMFVTKRRQPAYFASFWVEAIPIFWWIVLCLLEVFA